MRCKNCKDKFTSNIFLMKYCSKDECIKKFVESTKQKEWIVKKSKLKADLMTVQDYVKIAQTHFNNYIRKRDEGLNCISCDKPIKGVTHASHFMSAGGHSIIRFHEDNVWSSCYKCNVQLSGNLNYYRRYLIEKIGVERVEFLEVEGQKEKSWTKEELIKIKDIYKKKLLTLQ